MKQKAHSTRKHSDFAASSSHRWMNCPASVALSKNAPPQKESPYAMEGTIAHEVLEIIVRGYKDLKTAQKVAFDKYAKHESVIKYKFDVAAMVKHATASAKTIFKMRPSNEAKLLIETRVVLDHVGPGMFGTLDYAWVDEWGELTVIDFKYGAGVPVLPIDDDTKEPNSQLMYYASGIAVKFDYEFSHIRLAIIQPRVWSEGENPLTEGKVSIKALRAFELKLKAALAEAKKPDAKPIAPPSEHGDNWCRWCPAASFCPAISTMQMDSVAIDFAVETGLDTNTMPKIEALSAESLPKVLDACDHLEVWIEKVRAHAFLLASQGEKIPGRKLVDKRTVRYWIDKAEEKARKLFGAKAFSKPELLSPAQLEKAIGKEAKDFTAEYTDNKSSGYSLVKASDRRPEVSSPVIDFASEEGED